MATPPFEISSRDGSKEHDGDLCYNPMLSCSMRYRRTSTKLNEAGPRIVDRLTFQKTFTMVICFASVSTTVSWNHCETLDDHHRVETGRSFILFFVCFTIILVLPSNDDPRLGRISTIESTESLILSNQASK